MHWDTLALSHSPCDSKTVSSTVSVCVCVCVYRYDSC